MLMRHLSAARATVAVALLLVGTGCDDRTNPAAPPLVAAVSKDLTTPEPIVTVNNLGFWPYTGTDFSGAPGDPMNLVFFGQADPRALRAALLMLDGDRTAFGFPAGFPFDCTWHDVPEGNVETAYGSTTGWVGGVVQLACGEFGPVRFHLRFFDLGGGTVGGAHFELQIPGTATHQVLSWELAEQLVMVDFVRAGVLGAAPASSAQINAAPSYRDIPDVVYNGLPVDLRAAIGGPLANQSAPVPIPSDGRATVFTLAESVDGVPLVARQRFVIDFDQDIPKPFCQSGPSDALHVEGPVTLTQQVVFTRSGNYLSHYQAQGHLDLTPINPPGKPYSAEVNEQHHAILTDNLTLASSIQMQIEIPSAGPFRGRLFIKLTVGPGNASLSELSIRCGP